MQNNIIVKNGIKYPGNEGLELLVVTLMIFLEQLMVVDLMVLCTG